MKPKSEILLKFTESKKADYVLFVLACSLFLLFVGGIGRDIIAVAVGSAVGIAGMAAALWSIPKAWENN